MVLTNALLSIGFSLIANFTNVVPVPADSVPVRAEDLRQFVVGTYRSPVDLHVVHRRGTIFGIRDGVVYLFEDPGSFSAAQDPAMLPRFTGVAALNSNQIAALATRTVERLVKG